MSISLAGSGIGKHDRTEGTERRSSRCRKKVALLSKAAGATDASEGHGAERVSSQEDTSGYSLHELGPAIKTDSPMNVLSRGLMWKAVPKLNLENAR